MISRTAFAVASAVVAAADGAPADVDPAQVRVVVRDQIEASKTVQRALFAGWRAAPATAPRVDPDLTGVRADDQVSEPEPISP